MIDHGNVYSGFVVQKQEIFRPEKGLSTWTVSLNPCLSLNGKVISQKLNLAYNISSYLLLQQHLERKRFINLLE